MNVQPPTPRANRHGSECPEWCHIDHAAPTALTGRVVDTHISAAMTSGSERPRVDLVQSSSEYGDRAPEVHVAGIRGFAFASPGMAGDLADLIESLAACTPERLRALADEIRAAASVIVNGSAS
jgi:hypothetical protein